jgi:hypothetical protein
MISISSFIDFSLHRDNSRKGLAKRHYVPMPKPMPKKATTHPPSSQQPVLAQKSRQAPPLSLDLPTTPSAAAEDRTPVKFPTVAERIKRKKQEASAAESESAS